MNTIELMASFFENGGHADNDDLAVMFGLSVPSVRVYISALRNQGMKIVKRLYRTRSGVIGKAEYMLDVTPEYVNARRGRPSHVWALNA